MSNQPAPLAERAPAPGQESAAVAPAAGQVAAALPPIGAALAADPSSAQLLAGLTAAHLGERGAHTGPQLLPPQAATGGGALLSPAALASLLAHPTTQPSGPGSAAASAVAPGLAGATDTTATIKHEQGAGPLGTMAPLDASTPEAMAASVAARMSAAGATVIFEKALTASDVGGSGRVVVPKSVAEQYFPRLEQPSGVTISAADLDGRSYTFKWRFWVNNSSRMYLLEGAGELHRNYGLEVGDVMVFAQKPDGSLVVAGRMASKSDQVKRPPVKRPAAVSTQKGSKAAARAPQPQPDRSPAARPPITPLVPEAAAAASAMAPFGGAGDGGPARGRKRKAGLPRSGGGELLHRPPAAPEPMSLAVADMEAPSDGVFRAVAMQHLYPVPLGVALSRNNRWTATLDVAGELYQAFFDTKDDAVEALAATGASP